MPICRLTPQDRWACNPLLVGATVKKGINEGIMEFHSVTLLDSSSQKAITGRLIVSTFNMNEALTHRREAAYEKKQQIWVIALSLLGLGIGFYSAIEIFKIRFPAFWFFGVLFICLFGGCAGGGRPCRALGRKKASCR